MVRTPLLPIALLSAAVLAASACGESPSAAVPWDGTARDSAGVRVVLNHGTPLWTDSVRWTLEESFRIGVSDGDPRYMFGSISGTGLLSDGRTVVADGMAQNLRFFDSDGRWERTVGGPGSGPGEFGQGSLQILVGPGDTLLVLDARHQRANRITSDGTWIDSWPTTPTEGWYARGWDSSPAGRIVAHMWWLPGTEEYEADTMDVVILRGLDGTFGDTVGVVAGSRMRRVAAGRMQFYLFSGEPAVSICPDNTLVAGRGDRYEIRRYDPSGRLQQIIRLARPNVPITFADKRFLRARFQEIYLENGYTTEQVEELLAAMQFTDTHPAFVTLRCGPDGSVWTQPVKPVSALTEEERREYWVGPYAEADSRFDVFDRQGRYLGVVELPAGSWPDRFHGGLLLGRWRDSLDVEYLQALAVHDRQEGNHDR